MDRDSKANVRAAAPQECGINVGTASVVCCRVNHGYKGIEQRRGGSATAARCLVHGARGAPGVEVGIRRRTSHINVAGRIHSDCLGAAAGAATRSEVGGKYQVACAL